MADDTTSNEPVEGSWSPKRPRTTAEQRAKGHEGSSDPEVLADDIEKTREELAQTLDAIADKVSPKRVAKRTTKKAGDAAKEGVADAVDAVKDTVDAVKDKAGAVKDKAGTATQRATSGKHSGSGSGATVAAPVPAPLPGAAADGLAGAGDAAPADTTGSLADRADAATETVQPAGADLPPYRAPVPPAAPSRVPVLAGAAAAALVVLFVLRRRRR